MTALVTALFWTALTRPRRWISDFGDGGKMGLRSERGLIRTLDLPGRGVRIAQQLVHRAGVRHVHAHFASNAADMRACCAKCWMGPSYSFTMHGPEEFDRPTPSRLREKTVTPTFVAAISEYRSKPALPLGRSRRLDQDSRDSLWSGCRVSCRRSGSYPGHPRLVNIGRIVEQKGQLLLIEAAARLRDQGVEFEAGHRRRRSRCGLRLKRQIDRFD